MTEEARTMTETKPHLVGHTPAPSLTDTMHKLETINRGLRDRVRTDKMELLARHDQRWTDTQHAYARKIHDAVARLEHERDEHLRRISDEYHAKTREVDMVAARLSIEA